MEEVRGGCMAAGVRISEKARNTPPCFYICPGKMQERKKRTRIIQGSICHTKSIITANQEHNFHHYTAKD
jgi:hypothetical protein